MEKSFIAVLPAPDNTDLNIPGWVIPASSILFSVIATSVTITFFLSQFQKNLAVFDEKVSGKFNNILLMLEHREESLDDIKLRLSKLENNFTQLTRYVNRGCNNGHPFSPRNASSDDLETFS